MLRRTLSLVVVLLLVAGMFAPTASAFACAPGDGVLSAACPMQQPEVAPAPAASSACCEAAPVVMAAPENTALLRASCCCDITAASDPVEPPAAVLAAGIPAFVLPASLPIAAPTVLTVALLSPASPEGAAPPRGPPPGAVSPRAPPACS
jgi:hypothetical protein